MALRLSALVGTMALAAAQLVPPAAQQCVAQNVVVGIGQQTAGAQWECWSGFGPGEALAVLGMGALVLAVVLLSRPISSDRPG